MRRVVLVAASILIFFGSGNSFAQQYEDWSVSQQSSERTFSMGLNLGMPYVLGVDIASHFNSMMSAGLGLGFVQDLFTFGGQFRVNLLTPGADKTIPIVAAGINQYWIEDAGKNTDAVAVNILVGAEHFFGSTLSVGLHIGYIKTITESSDNRIKVWGINDDMSKLFLGVSGRYYF